MSMKSLMYMKGYPQRFWIISYTSLRICCYCYSLGHVNEIINVNEGPWRKATPKGSGSLLTPRSGFAATVIPWDIVLCNVKYKLNTDSCDSYLHVIMTLRPAALHSCPYGLILRFSLSRPASSMVGFWQLLFILNYILQKIDQVQSWFDFINHDCGGYFFLNLLFNFYFHMKVQIVVGEIEINRTTW